MTLDQYLEKINTRYRSGITTEHSFRGDLQNLLESWLPDVLVTNEPTRIACGAPDYILTRHDIPVGYIEAKDLGADLNSKGYTEQFTRYREALPNLVITNYLDFQFFKEGELVTTVSIGRINGNRVDATAVQQGAFAALLRDFSTQVGQTIKSSPKLAVMMANKAKLLAVVIGEALQSDEDNEANSTLKEQLRAFQDILIHEITAKEFADIYAQTIAYGMFAARLNDPTLPTFTRMEAAELIPKSNPFLRKLFQYIAGYDLDARIVWIVDALADIFRATDVAALLKNFGNATQQRDPIIHFYETFLSAYDPKLRKSRGVWYTPEPVVSFIVRAVDDILKTEFGLKDGLADTSKTKIKTKVVNKATADQRSKIKETLIEQEVHKVQILDPATGTGTFLAEVVKHIYQKKFVGQEGIWSTYVDNHLIPRLNGFELLMASYAMAHLKLELLLAETGYRPTRDQRLRVYLTNSLEEHHPDTGTLFASWLSDEANQANKIKRETPVMVVIGNPPYSVSSSNRGAWIQGLIKDYKTGLNEKKLNLDDDYIKFIRYAEYFIQKNGHGIVAMITNNTFIDAVTCRQMRKHLSETFDKIYVLDLHGSMKKREVSPDGSKDENVFDIQQGVSISLFVKAGNQTQFVYHADVFGSRESKYNFLDNHDIRSIEWQTVKVKQPYWFFVNKDFTSEEVYNRFPSLQDLFIVGNNGLQTDRDSLFIDEDSKRLEQRMQTLLSGTFTPAFVNEYRVHDSSSYKITRVIKDKVFDPAFIRKVQYRPFDNRYIYYDTKIISRSGSKVFQHFDVGNLALVVTRQQSTGSFRHALATDQISEGNSISLQTKERSYVFPLWLVEERAGELRSDALTTIPNFRKEAVNALLAPSGLEYRESVDNVKPSGGTEDRITAYPLDVFDYIYAVLYDPSFRERFREFLKIDFPRIPPPVNAEVFWKLVDLGGQLRQVHLLESEAVGRFVTKYPVGGANMVEAVKYDAGKVWINATQHFDGVPASAWEFYIGGYQPAQKWLKDRKGRQLTFEDILHYQTIIAALVETERLMTAIDSALPSV